MLVVSIWRDRKYLELALLDDHAAIAASQVHYIRRVDRPLVAVEAANKEP